MADYIERSKASELLCKMICGSERAICVSTCENCRQKQMVELYKIPAANVREDVQGKWIKSHWRGSTSCANCSVCDFEAQHSEFRGVQKYYKICPNCGARMVGGGER